MADGRTRIISQTRHACRAGIVVRRVLRRDQLADRACSLTALSRVGQTTLALQDNGLYAAKRRRCTNVPKEASIGQ
ncbi:hypothetical protein C4J83_2663 [Pseudomonas sp. LBUM920]|nr:hypothetical protein C4J83_2663 [Pseudomonas sp. LBUM920]